MAGQRVFERKHPYGAKVTRGRRVVTNPVLIITAAFIIRP
jgi:hypothetical protein